VNEDGHRHHREQQDDEQDARRLGRCAGFQRRGSHHGRHHDERVRDDRDPASEGCHAECEDYDVFKLLDRPALTAAATALHWELAIKKGRLKMKIPDLEDQIGNPMSQR